MAKSVSGKKRGSKTSVRKKSAKKSATKGGSKAAKKVAKKAAKKIAAKAAKKVAGKKAPGNKPASKKTASKKAVGKSAGRTSPAKKPAGKRTAAKKAPRKSSASKASRPTAHAAPAPLARKPLSTQLAARKTSRSRLAKRASREPVKPARKMALRTSLSRRPATPGETMPGVMPANGLAAFEPSALSFRNVTRADWPDVRRLLVEGFGRGEESELVERLRASRDLVAEYVADYAGRPVAHVGFSALNVTIDDRLVRAAGLAPVTVAAELERQGIATRLIVYGLENIRGLGHSAVFVLGDPAFFARFGFSLRLASKFDSPWSGPNYMAIEFEPGALRGNKGATVWPEAFSLV